MTDDINPHGPMPSPLEGMIKAEVRKLARQGRLVDHVFKVFSREVFPGASQEQVHVMRVCFYAGAAEMFSMMNAALDPGIQETEGDVDFMRSWVNELATFHEKTHRAWMAKKGRHAH